MEAGSRVVLNAGTLKGKSGAISQATEGAWEVVLDKSELVGGAPVFTVVAAESDLVLEGEFCRCPDDTWKPGGSMSCTCGAMTAERTRKRAEGSL